MQNQIISLEGILARLRQDSKAQTLSKLSEELGPLTTEEVESLLTACFIKELAKRGSPTELDEETKTVIRKVSVWFLKPDKPGLLLYGWCGTGKTTMLKAMNALFKLGRSDSDVIYTTAQTLFDVCKDPMMKPIYDEELNAKIMLVDDMGCEPERCVSFGTEYEPMQMMLYRRYDRQRITVISTNLDDEKILARYGERVAERLKESFDRLCYVGTNYRNR